MQDISTMRDMDRWKEKVELSLDGRQIFFIFFGSAVAACLIFVLGVLFGKRIEARAFAMTTPPIDDPLAALDQLGDASEVEDSLTFHKTLTRDDRVKRPVKEQKVAAPTPPAHEAKTEVSRLLTAGATERVPPAKGEPNSKVATLVETEADRSVLKPQVPAGRAQVMPSLPTARKIESAPSKKSDTPHFTLQLSAFPERTDAEEFMHKIQTAGYRPFIIASEIPGRGLFYRVRLGDYASRQAAVDAKAEFERKQRMIAYVAKL